MSLKWPLLSLTLLLAAALPLSAWHSLRFHYVDGARVNEAVVGWGALCLHRWNPDWSPVMRSLRITFEPVDAAPRCFGLIHTLVNSGSLRMNTLIIPLWIPLLLLTACTTRAFLRARPHPRNLCPACAYNLAGLPPQSPCPECGHSPPQP